MNSGDLPKVSFIPLSGKARDWPTWRTQFSALNIGTGVLELLEDGYSPPQTLNESTKRKSQLLYRNLTMCTMSAGRANNIILRLEFASSYDGIGAWQALCRKYESLTPTTC